MAATGKVLGTVTSVVGEAKATAADGTVRILQVGDVVHSDETITTSAAGAVNIALENGKTLDCGANSDLSLHESILGVATAVSNVPGQPGTAAPGSVEALQQAIASGQDPSQIAPATAAGGAPAAGGAGGDGSGGSPVIIEQANSAGPITAGINTAGGSITFPTPEFQLLAGEEPEPEVSVSVQVQVEVQVQVNVEVSVETGVEVLNGPAEGGVFAVSAGGDAVSLLEGSLPGTNVVPFVITLSQVFDTDVQVTYQILSGTADTPGDYFGVLTATITIPAGQSSFTVPVDIVRDHVVEGNETFKIVLVDAVNATINPDKDEAMVTIFNDDAPPVAHDDTNWTQEDVAVVATGNVVQNQPHAGAPSGTFADAADTDNFETPFVTNPGAQAGAHGSLVLNADGSYTYTLNNASAAVQALDSGETLTETFGYTISDGFNTPDSATLTVTIFGSNDVPEITVKTSGEIFAQGAQGTVDEAALAPNGSNPASNAEFVTGSFKVADTDGVDDIQSVTINGQTVAIGDLVGAVFHGSAGDMTVTAYADGVATFTYELLQAVTHNEANQTPPDVFTLTASDGTSDSAPANITINILDDVPSTQVTASQSTTVLTVDETDLATNASANFADDFAGGSSFGADGPGSVSDAIYTLSIGGSDSGLVDSLTGNPVTLVMNGGVVEGRVDNGDGSSIVFTVSVDGSGTVTLDQQRSVMHTPDAGADQPTTLISADLIVLSRSATITDADGDTANASASINIGQALVFEDDGPDINTSAAQVPTLTVDETVLATNASDNFAGMFTVAHNSTDGGNTITYSLNAVAGPSGLVDTATGQAVNLSVVGGVVEGRTAVSGDLVFTVSVNASGTVTLDQLRAVVHPTTNHDEPTTLSGANLVTLTATITDADADVDTATVNIGQALVFEDDGPDINTSAAQMPSLTVDETVLSTNDTESFAGMFTVAHNSTDGGNTVTYALNAVAGPSGLVDTATGEAVNLSLVGGVVEGRTAGTNQLVFSVSVDASGNVTLDQVRAVVHPTTNPDEPTTLSGANLVTLTATITDADGDVDTATLNIGQALVFEDDGPDINTSGAQIPTLTVDETVLATNASDSFAGLFTVAHNSTDGGNAITYSLNAVAGPSGLVDTATGQSVVLSVTGGGVVEGRTAISGDLVFTVSVNASGTVTLDQLRAVVHPTADPDEAKTLSAANLITLTATITDADGDVDTATVSIGQSLSFEDDGPAVNAQNMVFANEAGNTATASLGLNLGADAAGVVTITGETNGDGEALDADGNVMTSGGEALSYVNVGGVLYATTDGTPGGAVFSVTPNAVTGTYTVNMIGTLDANTITFTSNFGQTDAGGPADPYTSNFTGPNGELQVVEMFGFGADLANPSTDGLGVSGNTIGDNEALGTYFGVTVENVELALGNFSTAGNPDAQFQWSAWNVNTATFDAVTTPEAKQTFYDSITISGTQMFATVNGVPNTLVGTRVGGVQNVVADDNSESDTDIIGLDPSGDFNFIYLEGTGGSFKIESVSFETTLGTDPVIANFNADATDKDGDTATSDFVIHFSGTNLIGFDVAGTDESDVLNGGTGDDILTGGLGADVFQWGSNDDGSPAPVDTVIDFTQDPGDKLNLSELLIGEHANAGSLSSYLHFTASGGNTTIEIKSTGAGSVDQKIVLQGVDLTNGGAFNDATIIQNLLTAGKLQTDA